jgi:hypothetical protein
MKILKSVIAWFIILASLIAFWIIVPVVTNTESALSVIASSYDKSIFSPFLKSEIHKGKKINGVFESRENNLGILAIRFNTFIRINKDSLIFRIKEKNAKDWYYTGKYKVDQFQPNDFFTFGFPIIANSQNKSYIFQLESIKGERNDAVALSEIEPVALAKYQFTKAELLQNKAFLPVFIYKKIYYSFTDFNFFVSSLPFLLPLLFSMLSMKSILKLSKDRKNLFLQIFTLTLFIYLFLSPLMVVNSNLIFLAFWIFLLLFIRLESSVSFLYALIFLCLTPILLLFKKDMIAENFAIWTYYFLVVGTIQSIYELKKNPKNLMTYNEVVKNLIGVKNYTAIASIVQKW